MTHHERTEATTPTTRLVDLDAPPPGRQQPQQPPATEATTWAAASRSIAPTASAWAALAGYTQSLPDTWMSSGCNTRHRQSIIKTLQIISLM